MREIGIALFGACVGLITLVVTGAWFAVFPTIGLLYLLGWLP